MTHITAFSAQEADVIAALLVQAAINVSHAEDEDGERDDELELRALESSLREISKIESRPEIIRQLAKHALDSKDKWGTWSQGVYNIEPLCVKAMTIFKVKTSKDEAREYVSAVVDVATSVAQAYGEFGIEPDAPKGALDAAVKKIFGRFGKKNEADHPMNVTPAEESCIETISKALKNASGGV